MVLWKGVGAIRDAPYNTSLPGDLALVNVSWWYDWANAGPFNSAPSFPALPATPGVEYVPMMWGDWELYGDPGPAAGVGSATTLLGFNEPDDASQSNMTVARALALWPEIVATGLRIGAPAPGGSGAGLSWLASFMSGNGGTPPQVDFMVGHWYPEYNSGYANLGDYLDYLHTTYGRPVWLTEVGSLQGGVSANNTLIPQVMTILSTRPWVERIAWFFLHEPPSYGWPNTGLISPSNTITAAGTTYASYPAKIAGSETVPGVPLALSATASPGGLVGLTWTAPTSDGGAAITDYIVQYRLKSTGTPATGVIDRGESMDADAGSVTLVRSSATFTPAANTTIVAIVGYQARCEAGVNTDADFVLTDTFGDTEGGVWTKSAKTSRIAAAFGSYMRGMDIWTRQLGTGPHAGAVTATGSYNNGSNTTSGDGLIWLNTLEIGGAYGIKGSSGTIVTSTPTTGATTATSSLGAAADADSIVITALQQDYAPAKVAAAVPTGFTKSQSQLVTVTGSEAEFSVAYGNTSSSSVTWTNCDAESIYLLVATIEVLTEFNPLVSIPWVATFWAEDPAITTPPANGALLPATWNQPGTYTAVEWSRVGSPKWVSNWANGKPAVDFLLNDRLTTEHAATNQGQTTIAVVGATMANESDLTDTIDSNATRLVLDRVGGQWRMYRGGNIVSTTSDGNPHLFIARYFADNNDTLTVDGVRVIGPANVGNTVLGRTLALGSTVNNADHVESRIAFAGLVNAELTTKQRADLLAWYQGRYIASTFSDYFERADGVLGSEWQTVGTSWVVQGAHAWHAQGSPQDFAMFLHDLGSPDHWVEATIFGFSQQFVNCRRIVTEVQSQENLYAGGYDAFNARFIILKDINGNRTELVGTANGSYPNFNGKVRLEVEGTALRLYADGTLILNTTNAELTTGNYTGIHADNWAQGLDEFRCGILPYPGSAIPTVFSDDFNRANTSKQGGGVGGAGLGTDWNCPDWNIGSSAAQRGTGGSDFATYQHTTGTLNHWSEMTIRNGPAAFAYIVLDARCTGRNEGTCYQAFIRPGTGTCTLTLGKGVNGSYTDGPWTTLPASVVSGDGHKLRLETTGAVGGQTTIKCYVDDALIVTWTDTDASLNSLANSYCGMNANGGSVSSFRCGQLPYTAPVYTAVYSDNFNRADGPLGVPWYRGADPFWNIYGNVLYRNGSGDSYCRYDIDLGADHWVEADTSALVSGRIICLCVRRTADDTVNAPTGYRAYLSSTGANAIIDKVVNGVVTNVVTTAVNVGTAACKLRLEVSGTQQRLYRDHVLLATGNDTTLTIGGFVGLMTDSNVYPPWFDNFRCGSGAYTPLPSSWTLWSATAKKPAEVDADSVTWTGGAWADNMAWAYLTAGNAGGNDMLVEADVTFPSGTDWRVGVVARAGGSGTGDEKGYGFVIESWQSNWAQTWRFGGGAWAEYFGPNTWRPGALPTGTHKMGVKVVGQVVSVYFDGALVGSNTDTLNARTTGITGGVVAMGTVDAVAWNNVLITPA